MTGSSAVGRGLHERAGRQGPARRSLREFCADRYARCQPVIWRPVARAKIPSSPDARWILVAATAPLFHQLVLHGGRLSPHAAEQYARDGAAAASADIYRTSGTSSDPRGVEDGVWR
jgi:hypothetical protein